MADDRRPFLDLGGIDGEPPHSPHRNDIGIHLMSGAGTARAGRWDQDTEHAVAADPDSASVLRAEYGSAGADELDFGAGAGADVADEDGGDEDGGDEDGGDEDGGDEDGGDEDPGEAVVAEPPPPPSQEVVTGWDDSFLPDPPHAGYWEVAPGPGGEPGEGWFGGRELPGLLPTDAALAARDGTDPDEEGTA